MPISLINSLSPSSPLARVSYFNGSGFRFPSPNFFIFRQRVVRSMPSSPAAGRIFQPQRRIAPILSALLVRKMTLRNIKAAYPGNTLINHADFTMIAAMHSFQQALKFNQPGNTRCGPLPLADIPGKRMIYSYLSPGTIQLLCQFLAGYRRSGAVNHQSYGNSPSGCCRQFFRNFPAQEVQIKNICFEINLR